MLSTPNTIRNIRAGVLGFLILLVLGLPGCSDVFGVAVSVPSDVDSDSEQGTGTPTDSSSDGDTDTDSDTDTLINGTRVILDSDANNQLDDQHAIAYMLFSGGFFTADGMTVNATSGGGSIDNHALEAQRVVDLCSMTSKIPIYKGADGNFDSIRNNVNNADFDGKAAVDYIISRAGEPVADRLLLLSIGKLTNFALALLKAPSIAQRVRIIWLGSNYPAPGEYNQNNDESALNYILDSDVPFEIVLVRYDEQSGADAVQVTMDEINETMPGLGPVAASPVTGRSGGQFTTFGDYSVNLFENTGLTGNPPGAPMYDMAAVGIAKNPSYAESVQIPAPTLVNGNWQERPDNTRTITMYENLDRDAIVADFFDTMANYQPIN